MTEVIGKCDGGQFSNPKQFLSPAVQGLKKGTSLFGPALNKKRDCLVDVH